MKTTIKAIALVAMFAAPVFAEDDAKKEDSKPGKGIEKFDTNGDGTICKKERKAAMKACIAKHDKDGDGKLSKEEKKAAKQAGDLPPASKNGGKKNKDKDNQ